MNSEAAMAWADALVFEHTGAHLTELQLTILHQVWQGKRYTDIAQSYGCTEGHAKDTGAALWKLFSDALGQKVSKRNFQAVATRYGLATVPKTHSRLASEFPELSLNFVGRSQDLLSLQALEQRGIRAILIQGEGGVGKTTLAQEYLHNHSFTRVLELLIAKEFNSVTPVEHIVEEWLRRDFNEEPGRLFSVTLSRLKRHLQHQRIGVLIDNLEPLLDQAGCLVSPHRNYGELFRILTDPRNQSFTLMTSRDRLCEDGITIEHYRLHGLSMTAWQHYWRANQIRLDSWAVAQIHHTYGGNAKAMQLIGGMIREDYGGDSALYWHETAQDPLQSIALKNLVSGQIDRLAQLDPDAYRLLCRLGCYRFQEHATLPKNGLTAMLWDVHPDCHAPIIQSIRNRSLVEFNSGEYGLHPVVREEAIARLKCGNDWIQASRQAAHFWAQSVSTLTNLNDALKVWEAFYHYVEIQDYDAASQVILQPYHNQWQQYLPLGSLLYRMGLSHLVLTAILQILDHVQNQAHLSELNNILGDLYWITGQISQAIACQTTALSKAQRSLAALSQEVLEHTSSSTEHQRYYFRMLEIDSLFSLGLYHIDLWDLSKAETLLSQVIDLGQQTKHERWAEKATIGLALVKSYAGNLDTLSWVQPILDKVMTAQSLAYTGPFAYFIQRLGQIYANMGRSQDARQLYKKAIAYAQESQYTQVIATSHTGLAELDRAARDYDQALIHHQSAAQLLENIGATCDLAEAHLQWGITLRQLQKNATTHFDQAISLFHEIGAPLQIQRVKTLEQTCQLTQSQYSDRFSATPWKEH